MFCASGQPVRLMVNGVSAVFRFMGFQRRHIDVAKIDINIATVIGDLAGLVNNFTGEIQCTRRAGGGHSSQT